MEAASPRLTALSSGTARLQQLTGFHMADEIKVGTGEEAQKKTRRTFVKTAAQVAVTAPAVGLLLNASMKPASAAPAYGQLLTGDDAEETDHGGGNFLDSSNPDVVNTTNDDAVTAGDDLGHAPTGH
jgi:hypothetical protein